MADKDVFGLSDEESIEEFSNNHFGPVVRVIFTSTFSYHLKFMLRYSVSTRKEHGDHIGNFLAIQFHCFLFQVCHKPYMGVVVSTVNFKIFICDGDVKRPVNTFQKCALILGYTILYYIIVLYICVNTDIFTYISVYIHIHVYKGVHVKYYC